MFAATHNVTAQFASTSAKFAISNGKRSKALKKKVSHAQPASASFNTQTSERIFKEAQDLLPGGVNSPARAFKSVGGQPIVFDKVKGPCTS